MSECSAGFDLGTLAAQIATTDAGDATQWDTVFLDPESSSVYDDTHVISGKSAKLHNGGTFSGNRLVWNTALGTVNDYYWRMYTYMEDLPGAGGTHVPVQARLAGDTCWRVDIATDGTIVVRDAAGGIIATFTNLFPADQWVRFEGHTTNTGGNIEVKLFLSPDSTTATETKTLTGQSLRANTDEVYWAVGSLNTTAWFDELVFGAAAYPGPAGPVAAAAPQVLAMQTRVGRHAR